MKILSYVVLLVLTSSAVVSCGGGGHSASTGDANNYTIDGKVSGDIVSGINIKLGGDATATTTTNNNGNYQFTGLAKGTYTVSPSLDGYVFDKSSTVLVINNDITSSDFIATQKTATTFSLSGNVKWAPAGGVMVTLSGTNNASTLTDSSGNYILTGLFSGDYTVTPSMAGYTFDRLSSAVTINGSDVTDKDFRAISSIALTYNLSGTVTPLNGLTISISGTSNASTMPDSSGNYIFTGLASGSYVIQPSKTGYAFNPMSVESVVTNTDTSSVDFAGTPVDLSLFAGNSGGSGNIDGTNNIARFNQPYGVAVDSAGNIYVADTGNNTIRKITSTGMVSTFAGSPGIIGNTNGNGTAASFFAPTGVAIDSTGNVYIADCNNNIIRKITQAGTVTTVVDTTKGLKNPQGLAVDNAGNIYVADTGNNVIRKVTSTGAVTTFAGSAARNTA